LATTFDFTLAFWFALFSKLGSFYIDYGLAKVYLEAVLYEVGIQEI